jgi:hypothetical protein
MTLWSSDFHISVIADIKNLVQPMGVSVVDKSLSSHCHLTNTCETDLKVLNRQNGLDLLPCPSRLRNSFYQAYRENYDFMNNVDAFVCTHAASLCEVFMSFGKPMVIVVSTRFEIGRYTNRRWQEWNRNIEAIAEVPGNVIAANNRYDVEYLRYFTGLSDVRLLPTLADYVTARFSYSKPHYQKGEALTDSFLIVPGRGVHEGLRSKVLELLNGQGIVTYAIRDLYAHYEFKDVAEHPGVVILPYQV